MKIAWADGKKAGYILGDGGFKMLNVFPDVALNDYGIYITEGGKEDAIKQAITQLSQAALQSGNIDLLNVIKVLKSETLTEAEHVLENGIKEMQEQSKAAQDAQMQVQEAQAQEAQAQRDHELNLKELDVQGKVQAAEKLNEGKIAVANIQADLEANITSDKLKASIDKEAVQSEYKNDMEDKKLQHDKEKSDKDREIKKKEIKSKKLDKKQIKK